MIKQKTVLQFYNKNLINFNNNNIHLIVQISHYKLMRLLNNYFLITIDDLKYFFFKKKLIFITKNFNTIYKILSFLQYFNFNNSFLKIKKRKKHISNRIGFFKIDINEEKNLFKDENKPRLFKKSIKKKFKSKIVDSLTFYMESYSNNFLLKRIKFKNYLQIKNIFPENNILDNKFFLNFIFIYFKTYKNSIKNNLSFFQLKNFNLFFLILNFININIKIIYFFLHAYNSSNSFQK